MEIMNDAILKSRKEASVWNFNVFNGQLKAKTRYLQSEGVDTNLPFLTWNSSAYGDVTSFPQDGVVTYKGYFDGNLKQRLTFFV
jgi:hypothetical protein